VGARSKARKRALDVLYEADLRGSDPRTTLQERLAQADPPIAAYAVELVEGVIAHRSRIDELIAQHAVDWSIERMPLVDRNILRIGAYELLWANDIPDGVAVSEAVELTRSLSGDQSPAFVNGLLARLLELKAAILAEPELDQASAELPEELEDVDRAPGVGGEDTPADELLGQSVRLGVVDHGE